VPGGDRRGRRRRAHLPGIVAATHPPGPRVPWRAPRSRASTRSSPSCRCRVVSRWERSPSASRGHERRAPRRRHPRRPAARAAGEAARVPAGAGEESPVRDPAVTPVLPGATIGVLGTGQLGRMFAIAARRMGYRVHTLSPDTDTPTGQVPTSRWWRPTKISMRCGLRGRRLRGHLRVRECAGADRGGSRRASAGPARGHVLHTTQQRLREKVFLAGAGLPVAPSPPSARSRPANRARAARHPGHPQAGGLGLRRKGPRCGSTPPRAASAWAAVLEQECVLEALVPSPRRPRSSRPAAWTGPCPLRRDRERAPRPRPRRLRLTRRAARPAGGGGGRDRTNRGRRARRRGVLSVELFVTADDRLLVNELAPRPTTPGTSPSTRA